MPHFVIHRLRSHDEAKLLLLAPTAAIIAGRKARKHMPRGGRPPAWTHEDVQRALAAQGFDVPVDWVVMAESGMIPSEEEARLLEKALGLAVGTIGDKVRAVLAKGGEAALREMWFFAQAGLEAERFNVAARQHLVQAARLVDP